MRMAAQRSAPRPSARCPTPLCGWGGGWKLELSHRRRPIRGNGPLKLMLMLRAAARPRAPSSPGLSRSEGPGSGRFILQLSFLQGRGGLAREDSRHPQPLHLAQTFSRLPLSHAFHFAAALDGRAAFGVGRGSSCPLVSTLPVSSGFKGQAGKGAGVSYPGRPTAVESGYLKGERLGKGRDVGGTALNSAIGKSRVLGEIQSSLATLSGLCPRSPAHITGHIPARDGVTRRVLEMYKDELRGDPFPRHPPTHTCVCARACN